MVLYDSTSVGTLCTSARARQDYSMPRRAPNQRICCQLHNIINTGHSKAYSTSETNIVSEVTGEVGRPEYVYIHTYVERVGIHVKRRKEMSRYRARIANVISRIFAPCLRAEAWNS